MITQQRKVSELIRSLVSFCRNFNKPTSTMRSPSGMGCCSRRFSQNTAAEVMALAAAACYSPRLNKADYSAETEFETTHVVTHTNVPLHDLKFPPRMKG
jgi:hypothetical protein